MARRLVQLKLRLLRNALHSSTAAQASFLTSTALAILVAIGTFVVLALCRGQSASVDVTSVIFTGFAFGWLILPIFAFGLDSTLDPAALALYPLRLRPLVTGLLAASAAGAWPLANLIGLLGVTVGLARGPSGVLIAVVAVLLQVLFCIALARLVTTSMAGLLRSRRGKDFAALLIIPIFALYELFAQVVVPKEATNGTFGASSFAGIDPWLRWLPPGLAAHAIQDASDGHLGTALLRLALLAAAIGALGWLWVRSLSRALVTADSTTQSSRVRGAGLPLARLGLRGAVTARVWIYQRREPASLIFWALTAVIMVAVSARALLGPNGHPAFVLGSAVVGAGFVGYFHANAAGLTGPPFVLEATALAGRRELRSYFSGQNIALAAIAVPLITAVSLGLAAGIGKPGFGLLGAALGFAAVGAALGIGNILAVAAPYPMEKRAGNPMRQPAQGYTSHQFFNLLAGVGGTAVAVIPFIVATVATNADPPSIRMPILLLCGAAYGFALALVGVRIAAVTAEHRLPELAQVAIRSKL
jgi:ABC-2 type transport system permease protein